MSDDYVQWDVHASTDEPTPHIEFDDPLAQTEDAYFYNETPTHKPSSSPRLESGTPTPPVSKKGTNGTVPKETASVSPMTIRVSDPQKHQDGTQGTFITYLITTQTQLETFSSNNPRPVRRRYQDFMWLHTTLSMEYPACIIPPLPEKHRLEYIKGDRFSSEFIQRRQISLQWFLDRVSRHPILQKSQCTRIFLESTDFKNDKRSQVSSLPPKSSILDSISDTLVNAFAKIKKPDERFEELKESVNKLEENLNIIERLYVRINKRQQDIQNDYVSFADSIQGLSSLETNITSSLYQFSETTKAYSKAMKEMTDVEEMQFLNEIHELLAYCHAAKDVLRARDQKQLDFEELSAYLNQSMQLKERTEHPGRKYNDKLYITDYVTDKIKEVRGVNSEKIRRDKLKKLEKRIHVLQEEVAKANDDSNAFSKQVLKEFETFQETKTLELKQGLLAYADCHIEFYEKGVAIWERIIPILENIDGVKGDMRP